MARKSIVHFLSFLNKKQFLEYHFVHELNTVSVDVNENIELEDGFYLHFLIQTFSRQTETYCLNGSVFYVVSR